MYRLLVTIITYLLVSVHIVQAQGDIVMKIGGNPVYKSEFIKEYSNSQSISVDEFLPNFILRKIRIMDLQQRGVDTLTSFKILLANYQGEKLKSQLIDKYKNSLVKQDANNRFADNRWVKLQLIEKYIPQNSSKQFIDKQKASSDSIYNALNRGADFDALSISCSDRKDELVPRWNRKSLLPLEVLPMIDKAKSGDILPPVLTPSGYIIIKVHEQSESLPVEVVDRNSVRYLSDIDKKRLPENLDIDALKSELLYKLAAENDTASEEISESDLKEYFNKNSSIYRYDEPRFKGAVIHCSSKKMAKVVKKYLKDYDFANWQKALDNLTGNDKVKMIKMETGIFKKGDNKFVDKLVFEVKDGDVTAPQSLPYSFKMGKKLKKKPDSYSDIRDIVKSDLISSRLMLKNQDLVEKYKVEIDHDVLKTVNNSGSN